MPPDYSLRSYSAPAKCARIVLDGGTTPKIHYTTDETALSDRSGGFASMRRECFRTGTGRSRECRSTANDAESGRPI